MKEEAGLEKWALLDMEANLDSGATLYLESFGNEGFGS